jgi:hypothetical protein
MTKKIKFALVLLGAAYCVYYFMSVRSGGWHFIDNVDLVIHEAGHFIFAPFGQLVGVAGGSMMQLIIPLLFFGYFFRSEQNFSAAAMLLWLAINFFGVGVYAADAQAMSLPLLGGDGVIHDWNFLLSSAGELHRASLVAGIINFAGFASVLAAVWMAWTYHRERDMISETPENKIVAEIFRNKGRTK